jgi:hypothetical protein
MKYVDISFGDNTETEGKSLKSADVHRISERSHQSSAAGFGMDTTF